MRTPTNEQLSDSPDLISALQNKISQLESSLAELQRVVQVKDEALKPFAEATEACKTAFDTNYFKVCEDGPSQPPNTLLIAELRAAKKALECTPKDLPAFIPEEEYLRVKEELNLLNNTANLLTNLQDKYDRIYHDYLRVKQELVDLSRSHTVTALGKCIEKFELLKTHAEAMANVLQDLKAFSFDYPELKAYLKDFPK